ncbi:MAG: DUF2807 domain-containing protein [Bacteroidales bacterium]|nr:DUF2807 domain-containing protein [Bacteroidales bacterium]
MKQMSFLLLSVIFSLVGICNLKAETIKGNGNIVTKEIEVRDFDEITLSVPATVNFTQSEQYSCSITIDENLVQFISVKTVGDDLRIRQLPSKDGKPILSFSFGEKEVSWPNYQYATLQFTKFEINISAPRLEDVAVNGSGMFIFSTEFSNVKLDADVNGSGQVSAEKALRVDELDIELSGSGSVNFAQLTAEDVEVTVSGSGNSVLNGSFGELDLTLMGSGNIKVSGNSQSAKTKIAGSGDIYLGNVSRLIRYEIAGSGNIYYSGDAEIRGFTAGSGIIRKK